MVKKIDWIEFSIVLICLLFATILCLFHMSFDGYLRLTSDQWNTIWGISENGLALTMVIFIWILSNGIVRKFFKYTFIPYFMIKMIYHFSCFSGIYLMAIEKWEKVWSFILVILLVAGLSYCLILLKRR